MKKIAITRVHMGQSVNIESREHMYLEESATLKIWYVPEVHLLELISSKGEGQVVHAFAYNCKWYTPKNGALSADEATSKKGSSRVLETDGTK